MDYQIFSNDWLHINIKALQDIWFQHENGNRQYISINETVLKKKKTPQKPFITKMSGRPVWLKAHSIPDSVLENNSDIFLLALSS